MTEIKEENEWYIQGILLAILPECKGTQCRKLHADITSYDTCMVPFNI